MKKIQYKKICAGTILSLGLLISTQDVFAAKVNASISIPYKETDDWGTFDGLGVSRVAVDPPKSVIQANLSKNINLTTNNGYNLSTIDRVGLNQTLDINIDATGGSWSIFGRTHPFGVSDYRVDKTSWVKVSNFDSTYTQVAQPEDEGEVRITSSDPTIIDCSGSQCITKKEGNVSITISFLTEEKSPTMSDTWVYYKGNFMSRVFWEDKTTTENKATPYIYGTTDGFGIVDIFARVKRSANTGVNKSRDNMKTMAYSFPSITYSIIVGEGTEPSTSCSGVTIDENAGTATVNWTYVDNGGGAQTQYHAQLVSDTGSVLAATSGTTGTSATINYSNLTLDEDTTYRIQVQTTDASGGVSGWSTCGNLDIGNDSGGSLSVTCTDPSPLTITKGKSTTGSVIFSATTTGGTLPYEYAFFQNNNLGSGAVSSTGATYKINSIATSTNTGRSNSWGIPVRFTVTDSTGASDDTTCSVIVTDQNIEDDPDDPNNPGGGTEATGSFYFSPNIENSGGVCPIYIDIDNTTGCILTKRGVDIDPFATTSPNKAVYLGEPRYPVGTYTLTCDGTNGNSKTIGTKACYSNPDIREN